ncbi:hypothetical protein [uncultured Bacteroides sp.]|uniref:hypothetical protein n=1 Tax=uncultured Bacteroides sp. TaxID=162156 RepID=UPI002AA8647F|nr:hypothetical protein [uncultured Bacteroides sp.]
MKKQDFKKSFPDVCVQEITFIHILSRKDIEDKALALVEGLQTGLLGYESYGKELKVFTSYKFKDKLDKMVQGEQVIDKNTGLVGVITSEKPFICSCEMCVRVRFGESSDVYSCIYFNEK